MEKSENINLNLPSPEVSYDNVVNNNDNLSSESSKASIKRKNEEDSLNAEFSKKSKTFENKECSESDINCETPEDKIIKKKRRPRKNNAQLDPTEVKNVLDGMEEEIDDVLEETAQKNKLTATNVKNILRHVITNEYVLAMVRNTMKSDNNECGELEEAIFEPKLTRSKVKELREKQHLLPWPMSTPVKQQEPTTKSLLDEEFSEESSSDEDYKPTEDECHSEEDITTLSPKSTDLNSSFCEKSLAEKSFDEVEDEAALVVALSEADKTEAEATEADKIALRTRSKLPLNDTPLEAIETSFVAPDITADMYDTKCDDEEWQNFLRELSKPIECITASEKPDEEADDAENDPEYNVLEDDDKPDELDLLYDSTVKVTRRELNALMAEIMEYAQLDDCEEDDDENDSPQMVNNSCVSEVDNEFVENVRTQWMTDEERIQLHEQMRKHVQLLSQSYLLSFGIPELNYINISSKLFLDEIKMFASREMTVNEKSAFYAHNLDGALNIVNCFERNKSSIPVRNILRRKGTSTITSSIVKKVLFKDKVFMYPELLPDGGFILRPESKKAIFTSAEDNLIALGLEQFSALKTPVFYIQSLLMPSKTEHQIKLRIKNSKSKLISLQNPIKYYFVHKKAPSFSRTVQEFIPDNIKAPKDQPPELLPKWMRVMQDFVNISSQNHPILPKLSTQPSVNTASSSTPKVSQVQKYKIILPRNPHSSSLKYISPILKKYNQKRHILPSSPLINNSFRIRKNVRFTKRLVAKPFNLTNQTSTKIKILTPVVNNNNTVIINPVVIIKTDPQNNLLKSDVAQDNNENLTKNISDNNTLKNGNNSEISESPVNIDKSDTHNEAEVVDEIDEEAADDEHDSITLQDSASTSSITIKKQQPSNKKKVKQQKDLESSLALLQQSLLQNDPKRSEKETLFANSYLLRVTEILKDDSEVCEMFLKTLCSYQHSTRSPVALYNDLKEILKDYPLLVNDFVAFLNPEQAWKIGKYTEFIILSRIREFIRKVEVHFRNQPQHLLKILKTLAQFKQQTSITSAEVLNSLQPLLKNQTLLVEELTSLLPDLPPPENFMTDFEEVVLPNSDDNSSIDSCEEIIIPDIPDPYGGKDCPCDCHTSSTEAKVVNKSKHCVKCGIKFIDGRIYIQTGKVLKPAQVIYHETPPEPTKVPSNDSKPTSKTKQPQSSSNVKSNTSVEQPPKVDMLHVKKDVVKTCVVTQQSVTSSEEPVPVNSKLPCDVIEDTVFPTVSNYTNKKSVPSDFSHLKDVIGQKKHKEQQPKTLNEMCSDQPSCSSSDKASNWDRDEDKIIIYNCQRFGITERAFESSASILERTNTEVQERFVHLMNLLQQEMKIK